MTRRVAVIPGDGVGPEVIGAAVKILEHLHLDLKFEFFDLGYCKMRKTGEAISDDDVEAIKEIGVVLMGPVQSPPPSVQGYRSPVLTLRRELDLYVNLRPIRSLPAVKAVHRDVDIVVVRENLEDIYVGLEEKFNGECRAVAVFSERNTRRLAEFAFNYALQKGRSKVTVVHKANVLRRAHGLFLAVCQQVASRYPSILFEEMHVDTAAMQMAMAPQRFDVILTTNLFGDILSSLGYGLIGGPGVSPTANLGDKYAIFSPAHGSAPDIAGKNAANPIAAILSAAMMLEWLGLPEHRKVEQAVRAALLRGVKTRDLGGAASTSQFTEAVLSILEGESR
ncbi:MAG: isocitrate/isopropylmalate dehydrogenase family protein [Candidatus Verstraetearchaeota archaeon]|nr:isocitrate/isopropylmalate dehydrogenase family protein [Candidatus Verstraetearchaeota archaeon]